MKQYRGWSASVLLGITLLLSSSALYGQTLTTGDVTGTITDPSGAVVPGAQVTIRFLATNETRTDSSNASGVYRFSLLQPGEYEILCRSRQLEIEYRQVYASARPGTAGQPGSASPAHAGSSPGNGRSFHCSDRKCQPHYIIEFSAGRGLAGRRRRLNHARDDNAGNSCERPGRVGQYERRRHPRSVAPIHLEWCRRDGSLQQSEQFRCE